MFVIVRHLDSDLFRRDHLHLDLQNRANGSHYCR